MGTRHFFYLEALAQGIHLIELHVIQRSFTSEHIYMQQSKPNMKQQRTSKDWWSGTANIDRCTNVNQTADAKKAVSYPAVDIVLVRWLHMLVVVRT